MTDKTELIYTGGGFGGSWQGIPARDLTGEEVKKYGGADFLIGTGLYRKVEAKKTKKANEKRAEE